ncbi:MAG: hypothetical protein SVZ03_07785 [Spirochaetota bacterium]|nr:hypothetical protein [Spirochaetota bacterium]
MNLKKMIIIVATILCGCTLFQAKKNSLLTESEISILDKTTNALDYGYGYDREIELDYIYSHSFSEQGYDQKEEAFAKIVNKINPNIIAIFHEKIYRIYAMTDYKMNKYKNDAKWKYHIFIKNELFPPLDKYLSLLQKYISKRDSTFVEDFNYKRKLIDKDVERFYTEQEEVVDTF